MLGHPLFRVAFALSLAAAGCGGVGNNPTGGGAGSGAAGSGGSGGTSASSLPCDVDAILGQHCRSCHAASPIFGAPMPLVTLDDLHAPLKSDPSKKVYTQISARIHDAQSPMPPPPNEPLGASDAAVLDTWVEAGAPGSSIECGSGGSGGTGTGGTGGVPLSCTPDVKLQPGTPWVMPQATTDEYVCYGVDVEVGAKRHVTALAPLIDNATIVHHMLLFTAKASYGPTPQPCGGANMGQLVGVWAPGGGALELPAEAGYPIEGTAHFVLQIHYSNLMGLSGQEDSSGYQLCTTDQLRPNDADILAFGTNQIDIPAQGSADITCNLTLPAVLQTLHGVAAMPHMHKLGTAISTTLHPKGGGTPVDLGAAEPWNFESQAWTMLGPEATLQASDTVSTRCKWVNPTAKDVHFGEQTSDEMCFGFLCTTRASPRRAGSGLYRPIQLRAPLPPSRFSLPKNAWVTDAITQRPDTPRRQGRLFTTGRTQSNTESVDLRDLLGNFPLAERSARHGSSLVETFGTPLPVAKRKSEQRGASGSPDGVLWRAQPRRKRETGETGGWRRDGHFKSPDLPERALFCCIDNSTATSYSPFE
ncbi:MAG: hypothetical protein IPK82_41460 [Polyangiaceae bacterium]|nr:hypothetical protein [Polyangiaceae bacterium]